MAKVDPNAESDWLKYYCIVFGLLIVVVLVLYFKITGEREEYALANSQAERYLTGKGLRKPGPDEAPKTIPGLALDVKQYVDAFQSARGGEAAGAGISVARMERAAVSAGMTQTHAGTERREPNRAKNYLTVSRDFTYAPADVERLVKLMYNIELRGRYRVYEANWTLAEEKVQTEPPRNKIGKSVLRVGYREPLADER